MHRNQELDDLSSRIDSTVRFLTNSVGEQLRSPAVGIICGSGLGGLHNTLQPTPQVVIPYSDIPHFPKSTVPGHKGLLVFGLIEGGLRPVILMVGRLHFYEGHSIQAVTFPIRVMKRLGVETLIVTNAAGGLNAEYAVGDIMIINDHVNFVGMSGSHPLRGPNPEEFGPRFPALSDAYDLELRRRSHQVWKDLMGKPGSHRRLHEGIYAFVSGPSFETRAECRLLRLLGADTVGMSTVPEVTVARHCNMRVLALSLVTNKSVLNAGPRGDQDDIQDLEPADLAQAIEKGKANHEEVLDAAKEAERDIQNLVCQLVKDIMQER